MSERAPQPRRRIIFAVMMLTLAVVVISTAWLGMNVLLLTFAAICVAILLDSLSAVVTRYARLSRGKSLAVVVILIVTGAAGIVWLMAPSIARQFDDLAKTLPEQTKKLEAKLMEYRWGRMLLGETFTGNNGDTKTREYVSVDNGERGGQNDRRPGPPDRSQGKSNSETDTRSGISDQNRKLPERVQVSVKEPSAADSSPGTPATSQPTSQPGEKLTRSVQAAAEPMVKRAGHWATGLINAAVMAVVVFIAGIYMAIDPKLYIEGTLHLVPKRRRDRLRDVFAGIGYSLRWWLVAQGVTMLVIGVLTGVGLWLIGVRLWLTFALLAGLFNFVPNFGPLVSFIPAVVFTLAEPNGLHKAAWIAGLFVVTQSFEGYFLTPMIQKKAVDTPPALLILFQVLAGYMLGSLGLMLAAPLLAAIVVAVKMLYVQEVLGDPIEVNGAPSANHQ